MEKKSVIKSIRFTQDEIEQLEKFANGYGISISEYIRSRSLNHYIRSRIEIDLISQIKKIGNNINQIARYANVKKTLDYNILKELKQINNKLDELIK